MGIAIFILALVDILLLSICFRLEQKLAKVEKVTYEMISMHKELTNVTKEFIDSQRAVNKSFSDLVDSLADLITKAIKEDGSNEQQLEKDN